MYNLEFSPPPPYTVPSYQLYMKSVPELWHIRPHLRLTVNTVNGCFYQSVIAFFLLLLLMTFEWNGRLKLDFIATWWCSHYGDNYWWAVYGRAISANRLYTLPLCIFSSRHILKIKWIGSLPFRLRGYDGLFGEGAGNFTIRVNRDFGLSNVP